MGSCVSFSFYDDIVSAGQWASAQCEFQPLPYVCEIGISKNFNEYFFGKSMLSKMFEFIKTVLK